MALGVDVDLCDAERNSLLDHILRDACSAVENKGHIPDGSLDISEDVKAQTRPVSGVLAVDVADTGSKHRNSEIRNLLALLGISALAHADNAVLLAADSAYLSLERNSEDVTGVYESGGELDVFLNGIVRAVEHDRAEAGVNAGLSSLKCAVVKVKSYRNGDSEVIDHSLYHSDDGCIAAHILSCALGYTENYGSVELLSSLKNCLCPLQIVDVELTDSIVAVASLVEHFLCRYEHCYYLRLCKIIANS